jgi:alkanesulfonate monooxygenase SsuD/methylene tetrahydromethanopterin reductase-like flavin-dependent oxidoreductase (luciferase family)
MMGGGPPEMFSDAREKLEAAFRDAGRREKPIASALSYFSLDADPEPQARATIGHYYSFMPQYVDMVVTGPGKGEDEVRDRVRAFAERGCDELILFPAFSHPDQVDNLAAAVL